MTDEKFYTIQEVAELLKVSPSTIRAHIKSGKLEGYKIGSAWRFTQTQIDRYVRGES